MSGIVCALRIIMPLSQDSVNNDHQPIPNNAVSLDIIILAEEEGFYLVVCNENNFNDYIFLPFQNVEHMEVVVDDEESNIKGEFLKELID